MLDCEGPAAGRGHDYEEKYVAMKPLSPSKDFKKEDIKEYKVSEPSTLHLARPSVVCCAAVRMRTTERILTTRWC